jgi:TPR repeat protein
VGEACWIVGVAHASTDVPAAAAAFQRACAFKVERACAAARVVVDGADPATVKAYFFKTSCDEGDLRGCYNLGVAAEHGKGIPADPAAAAANYAKACEGGVGLACANLGHLHEERGDAERARALYHQACANGVAFGCTNEGILLVRAREWDKAKAAFQKGCDGGDKDACEKLKKL